MRASLLALSTLLLVACSYAAAPAGSGVASTPDFRVYVNANGTVERLDSAASAVKKLPGDLLSTDGRRLYATYGPLLRSFDSGTGALLAELSLSTHDGRVGGQSPSGSYLAVISQSSLVSRFDVVAGSLAGPVRTAVLDGSYSFDALTDDGRWLYLIESAGGLDYRVRRYDLVGGTLDPNVLVEKGASATAVMNGERYASVAAPGSQTVYSLYYGRNGAFIHALSLGTAPIECIDLPGPQALDPARQQEWTLAMGGGALYAVNAAIGVVSRVNPDTVQVRSGTFSPPESPAAWSPFVEAKAKESFGGSAVVSADGSTLYATGLNGYVAIDTRTLKVRGSYLAGSRLGTLAMTPDGKALLAVRDGNRLVEINPADGTIERVLLSSYGPLDLLRVDPVG
jgi:hypothetical protein